MLDVGAIPGPVDQNFTRISFDLHFAVAYEQYTKLPINRSPPEVGAAHGELVVAQRAIDLKKAGEPLDRVLRMQEIAWEESPARRERLEKVATRWYGYESSFQPEALRIAVISDCRQSAPVP